MTPLKRRPETQWRGFAAAFMLAGALLALVGCSPDSPAPPPTGAGTPSSTAAVPDWGGYGGRDEACTETANNIISLGLVPTNLSFATDPGAIADIRTTIEKMTAAAPAALTSRYETLATLVDEYSSELNVTPTPTPVPSTTPSGTATGKPGAHLDADAFGAQVNGIKKWLTDNCSG